MDEGFIPLFLAPILILNSNPKTYPKPNPNPNLAWALGTITASSYRNPNPNPNANLTLTLRFINVVTCLVRLGADRGLKNRWNKSPIDIASERGHRDILRFLAPDWKGPR